MPGINPDLEIIGQQFDRAIALACGEAEIEPRAIIALEVREFFVEVSHRRRGRLSDWRCT
jgi:hypothetical protein